MAPNKRVRDPVSVMVVMDRSVLEEFRKLGPVSPGVRELMAARVGAVPAQAPVVTPSSAPQVGVTLTRAEVEAVKLTPAALQALAGEMGVQAYVKLVVPAWVELVRRGVVAGTFA